MYWAFWPGPLNFLFSFFFLFWLLFSSYFLSLCHLSTFQISSILSFSLYSILLTSVTIFIIAISSFSFSECPFLMYVCVIASSCFLDVGLFILVILKGFFPFHCLSFWEPFNIYFILFQVFCFLCVIFSWYLLPSMRHMAPHSSTLAWKIPWTEEPGRLQSMGLQRVRHDWATSHEAQRTQWSSF